MTATDLLSRTIIRKIRNPNPEVCAHLEKMFVENSEFLAFLMEHLRSKELRPRLLDFRPFRNDLVKALSKKAGEFESHLEDLALQKRHSEIALLKRIRAIKETAGPHMQDRQWKVTLEEAFQIANNHWAAVAAESKKRLLRWMMQDLNNDQRHYVHWLLTSNSRQFFSLLDGNVPNPTEAGLRRLGYPDKEVKRMLSFERCPPDMLRIAVRVRWQLRHTLKKTVKYPRCRSKANRMYFDAQMWSKFDTKDGQTVSISSLIPMRRIELSLCGHSSVRGTFRLMKTKDGKYQLHIYKPLTCEKERTIADGEIIGIDIGYTEVFVDIYGNFYGKEYGKTISQVSDRLKLKTERRNKLHAAVKNLRKTKHHQNLKKARRIEKHNLGRIKLNEQYRREKEHLKMIINRELNALLKNKNHPIATLVYEDLTARMAADFSRPMNRRLSQWLKGYLRQRIGDKCKKLGIQAVPVNPAYTSRLCPNCGCFLEENRHRDLFKCRNCGAYGHADVFAAWNIVLRIFDSEIRTGDSKEWVKGLLNARYSVAGRKGITTVTGKTDMDNLFKDLKRRLGELTAQHYKSRPPCQSE